MFKAWESLTPEDRIYLDKFLMALGLAVCIAGLSTCSQSAHAAKTFGWGVHIAPDREHLQESQHVIGTPLWGTKEECERYMWSKKFRGFVKNYLEQRGDQLTNQHMMGCKPVTLNYRSA